MLKNYYKILKIAHNADPEKVKSAFRNLAKKYHPDIAGTQTDDFVVLKEAFETLSNPVKRRSYDREIGVTKPFNEPYRSDRVYVPPANKDVYDDVLDVVADRFNLPRKHDLIFDLYLSDEEFKHGAKTAITIPREKICPKCFGFGGTILTRCKTCGGGGLVSYEIEFDLALKPPLKPGQVYEITRKNHRLQFRLKRGK
ncbi:MAG: DnaJ domain-containing protein [candidate division Zixibacteria bacterium]|nr:DnaJ domain-containing protein [candidate division Zixibacteria bacterium]